jgi:hypothetical protein
MDPDTGQTLESPAPAVPGRATGESGDDYPAVVAVLGERWRVIDSCERPPYRQWILQYRDSLKRPHRWTAGVYGSFCQTRLALERCIREKVLSVDPAALAAIRALPERIAA